MRVHFRSIGAALTAFTLTAGLLAGSAFAAPVAVSQAEFDPVIRVGLYYNDTALPTANLENSVGNGYFFGYYDSELNFQPLAETEERRITLCTAATAPGRYHLQVDEPYWDSYSAMEAAALWGGYLYYENGTFWVRLGSYATYEEAAMQAVPGISAVEDSSTAVTAVITGTSSILFQFDGYGYEDLAVLPDGEGEQATTWFKGFKYYGGFVYQTLGDVLSVVNVVALEDYVKGVVTVEMSPSWPIEALKAQAVCARNYAYQRLTNSKHAGQGFDICNTVHCQAYSGMKAATAESDAAVDATYGEYVWYDGEIVETNYYSSNGGGTENSENVWTSAVPHLRGVTDPFEALVADQIPKYNWTVTYTKSELSELMNSKGYSNSGNVSVHVSKTSPTGNVIEVILTDLDTGRTWTKRKEEVRTFFGLRSMRYTINGDDTADNSILVNGMPVSGDRLYALDGYGGLARVDADDAYIITADGVQTLADRGEDYGTSNAQIFTFNGTGWGHHVGMSQWGAFSMAQQGYTYQEILKFYYTGIEIRQP